MHNCEDFIVRNDDYDAYVCLYCNTFLEVACTDPECYFCVERPLRPYTKKQHKEILQEIAAAKHLKTNEEEWGKFLASFED